MGSRTTPVSTTPTRLLAGDASVHSTRFDDLPTVNAIALPTTHRSRPTGLTRQPTGQLISCFHRGHSDLPPVGELGFMSNFVLWIPPSRVISSTLGDEPCSQSAQQQSTQRQSTPLQDPTGQGHLLTYATGVEPLGPCQLGPTASHPAGRRCPQLRRGVRCCRPASTNARNTSAYVIGGQLPDVSLDRE